MNKVTISRDDCLATSPNTLNFKNLDSMTFILFGATGDLPKRKIFPALYNLFLDGKLPEAFSIIGLGRRKWSDYTFHMHINESIQIFSRRSSLVKEFDQDKVIKITDSVFRGVPTPLIIKLCVLSLTNWRGEDGSKNGRNYKERRINRRTIS